MKLIIIIDECREHSYLKRGKIPYSSAFNLSSVYRHVFPMYYWSLSKVYC